MLNRVTSILLAGSIVLAGCNVFTNQAPEVPASVPPAKATPIPQLPTVQVKRGTIVDAVKVLGRVVSSQEADLSFRNSGRIREVYVQPGDLVQPGQVLAELDQRDLPWSLAKAKLDVERQQVRVAAAQAKSVVDDTRLDELSIRAAEIALKQAELGLEKARAGALDADVKKAESDVAARQAELDRTRFEVRDKEATLAAKRVELAAKQLGADGLELATARAAVETARIRLEQLRSGPRVEDIRAAEIALDLERTKLAKVREQPRVKPEDLANARIEVEKAHVALTRVLADIDAGTIRGEQSREIAVRAAQIDLERTQNALTKLESAAPAPEEIRAQEQAVQLAELSLQKVRGVQANDVEAAQANLTAAQIRLDQLEKGPAENELTSLRTQVQSMELALEASKGGIGVAESNLAAARAKLTVLTRGPLDFDVRDAQNRVALAVSGVQTARARLTVKRETTAQQRASVTFEIEQLRRSLQQVELDVANLEAQTGDVKIVAPFAGRITRVAARPGDTVNAFMPLFNVSSLEGLVVKADIPDSDLARITPGMKADLTMDAYPNQALVGTIEALPDQVVGSQGQAPDRSTRVSVQWPGPGAEMGMLARVQVTLQVKPNVLMVPNGAVRVVGKRKFVEYLDGDIKRSRNVETGIQTDSDVEITTGLPEGMVILAGQS
jgi:RND family efflux transporter MFP subunit